MNLPDTEPTRKQRFESALVLAGLTLEGWAELHGISRQHLRLVFLGDRKPSAELDMAISETIAKYLPAGDPA